MTQEEKDLLLRDLCARLPYGVIIQVPALFYATKTIDVKLDATFEVDDDFHFTKSFGYLIENVKPYLRPMSSMTEEEKEKYCELQEEFLYSSGRLVTDNIADMVDWLNTCHFDWHGLIPKGLALKAPQNMYNIK